MGIFLPNRKVETIPGEVGEIDNTHTKYYAIMRRDTSGNTWVYKNPCTQSKLTEFIDEVKSKYANDKIYVVSFAIRNESKEGE